MKQFITKHLRTVLVFSLFAITALAGLSTILINHANAVSPTYSYQYVSQTTNKNFAALVKGDTATVTFKVKNTGTATWQKTGSNPVHVGTTNPNDRISSFANSSWIGANRPTGVSADVLPGKTTTFTWTMTAPTTVGHYNEYFSLVAEGKTWMNNAGLYYSINVVPKSILTISAPIVTLSKPYDGNTSVATCTPGTLSGKVGVEVVTATCVATYADAAVGTGKTINVVYTLAGTNAGNYVEPVGYHVHTGIITDSTAPHLDAVTHNETAKTITYTWNEPVQLRSEVDPYPTSAVTAGKLDVYTVNGVGAWNPHTPTAGIAISTATFDGTGTILTVTYTGNLEKQVDTNYVVDATDYGIVDLTGNLYQGEEGVSPIFTVDAINPDLATPASSHVEGDTKTITYNFTEPVQFIRQIDGTVVEEADIPAILNIFVATPDGDGGWTWNVGNGGDVPSTVAPGVTIETATFSSNNTVLTVH